MDEGEDDYHRVWGIMAQAFQEISKTDIAREEIVPAISDLVTSLALYEAGEAGVRAVMLRMEGRIGDWKAGRFPTGDVATNKKWMPVPQQRRGRRVGQRARGKPR